MEIVLKGFEQKYSVYKLFWRYFGHKICSTIPDFMRKKNCSFSLKKWAPNVHILCPTSLGFQIISVFTNFLWIMCAQNLQDILDFVATSRMFSFMFFLKGTTCTQQILCPKPCGFKKFLICLKNKWE